jgi:cell wall-associated NlpC family hydrolase
LLKNRARIFSLLMSLALLCSLYPGKAFAIPASTNSTPTVDQAINTSILLQQQLDQKNMELELVVENHRVLEQDIALRQQEKASLEDSLTTTQQQLDDAQAQLNEMAVAMYQRPANDSELFLAMVLQSDSFDSVIALTEYFSRLSEYQSDAVVSVRDLRTSLNDHREKFSVVSDNLALLEVQYSQEELLIQQEILSLNKQAAANKVMLVRLQAAERAAQLRYLADITRSIDSSITVSAARKKVVSTALQQLGKPYVWAAAGPKSFDCSGLILYAYRSIGVSLPHYSRSQYAMTQEVPVAQLQPGDLIFIGDPPNPIPTIHHVIMYIGNGYTIEAPRTGDVVKIMKLSDRDLASIAGFRTVFVGTSK